MLGEFRKRSCASGGYPNADWRAYWRSPRDRRD